MYEQCSHKKQSLLFKETPFISEFQSTGVEVPEDFYLNGYTIIKINNLKEVRLFLYKFIASIQKNRLPIRIENFDRIQLAKLDLIPVCPDIIQTSFQALHFDMGQPIFSENEQTVYNFLALYCPLNSKPLGAKTRVVSIERLLSQRKFGDCKEVEKKLIQYVKSYGDGWIYPDKVNTFRLACFARFIDAVEGTHELADFFDKTTGQWFKNENTKTGEERLELEYEFFRKHGLDIKCCEEQIEIKPGELLIVDNIRAVHGRIGPRNPKEIYQFLFGIERVTPQEIAEFRRYIVNQLSKEISNP